MATQGWLAVGFGAVLLLGACGGDSDDGTSADDTSDAVLAELPDEEELQPGLLTIDDVPAGWSEIPDDGAESDPLCGISISRMLGFDVDEMPHAAVQFAEDEGTGPSIGEEVGFAPEGRGGEAFDLLETAIADCDSDTVNGLDATVAELSFPRVGEESLAYRIHVEDPTSGQELDLDVVWARQGDLLVYVFAYDTFGDPTQLLQTYAQPAVDKATAALVGD